jgi:hypothetical protein
VAARIALNPVGAALAYQAMLTNSRWGVYQMIGKLNPRLYVLSR